MSKLLAPNGKPSNLTPEQYKLVRSKEFISWFGDWEKDPANASKVVDENGEPLPVYHGTNAEFYKFKKSKGKGNIKQKSINFSSNKNVSENYGTRIIECFLNLKNPFIKNYNGKNYHTITFNSRFDNRINDIPDNIVNNAQTEKKYDGVIFLNIQDSKSAYDKFSVPIANNYYAFNNNQIKLADGTNTTFNGSNPDIRFKDGGIIKIDGNIFKVKLYLEEHSYDRETDKETPMWFFKVYKMNGNDVDGILTEDNNLEGYSIGSFDSRKKAKDFLLKYSEELNVILLDDNGIGIKFFNNNNPDIRFDEGGAIKKVNVVDIKQYTMGGVNYRFVEIAEKKYNKIEVYRQYEDDGKYWGVLLYRRVPRYDFKFSSPMINNLNQLFAYPFHSSSSDEELFDAVKYKKKPFGSLSHWISYSSEDEIYEKFKVFIAQCSEYNLEYSIINDKERITFQFCQKGTFDELFNIDNLIEDYKNNGFEDVELKGIKKFRYYDLSYFLNNEWDADGVFGFPLTGLILGIPPKFTMSILNMWTTYDLSKEYKYSENVIEEKYSVGGEVKTINVLSDIWKWFGIKF